MTIYTHSVVGLGLGVLFAPRRMPPLYWALAASLPMIPDLDAFSVASYGDNILGHRGLTHTLTIAMAMGLSAAALAYRSVSMNFWRLAGIFSVITASHGVLDAFTHGGAGIPFFWPFSDHRFGGWGPVLVPDIAFEIPDPRTSRAIRGELLWVWLPTAILVGVLVAFRRFMRRRADQRVL
jgi:inner membrane protein